MKKITVLLFTVIIVLGLSGCCISHEFIQANCVSPATCVKCGETEGEALGHDWIDANCLDPKICVRCNIEQGSALGHRWVEANCSTPLTCSACGLTEGKAIEDGTGHKWVDATCIEPKTCAYCKLTEGEALGHTWLDATCTSPQTCSVCSETEGEALGHSVSVWSEDTPSTCIEQGKEAGVCSVCSDTLYQPLPLSDHNVGEWEVIEKATVDSEGTRIKRCLNCEAEMENDKFPLFEIKSLNYIGNSYGYHDFSASIVNNSDITFESIFVSFVLLDSENNIVGTSFGSEHIRVNPGQSITIKGYCEDYLSANYFSVDNCSIYIDNIEELTYHFPEIPDPMPLGY